MFDPKRDILFEDNHLIIVNKQSGQLVQADNSGDTALEDELKDFIKIRDKKPGAVFLSACHRIDRPVSGCVIFAKTSKALSRMNEAIRDGKLTKIYWAIVDVLPKELSGELRHYIYRDGKTNRSRAYDSPRPEAKESRLKYRMIAGSRNYHLLEIELLTGRHHQIRCQLAKIGSPIRGDLKYGAPRSNEGGGISLHSRRVEFSHPVGGATVVISAPVPAKDNLWRYFEEAGSAEA